LRFPWDRPAPLVHRPNRIARSWTMGTALRDRDVRHALKQKLLRDHLSDPRTLVLEELGLRHGTCRVDIAIVNGQIHGYEIKSDSDTLERLPSQLEIYSRVLDQATLVVGSKHADKAISSLPEWWGIRVATIGPRSAINFELIRKSKRNPNIDPIAVAELLWRSEVIEILRKVGIAPNQLRQPRSNLYCLMTVVFSLTELRKIVRQRLKDREKWRGRQPPSLNDDLLTPIPT